MINNRLTIVAYFSMLNHILLMLPNFILLLQCHRILHFDLILHRLQILFISFNQLISIVDLIGTKQQFSLQLLRLLFIIQEILL